MKWSNGDKRIQLARLSMKSWFNVFFGESDRANPVGRSKPGGIPYRQVAASRNLSDRGAL
jgi:hypothetical protein